MIKYNISIYPIFSEWWLGWRRASVLQKAVSIARVLQALSSPRQSWESKTKDYKEKDQYVSNGKRWFLIAFLVSNWMNYCSFFFWTNQKRGLIVLLSVMSCVKLLLKKFFMCEIFFTSYFWTTKGSASWLCLFWQQKLPQWDKFSACTLLSHLTWFWYLSYLEKMRSWNI